MAAESGWYRAFTAPLCNDCAGALFVIRKAASGTEPYGQRSWPEEEAGIAREEDFP